MSKLPEQILEFEYKGIVWGSYLDWSHYGIPALIIAVKPHASEVKGYMRFFRSKPDEWHPLMSNENSESLGFSRLAKEYATDTKAQRLDESKRLIDKLIVQWNEWGYPDIFGNVRINDEGIYFDGECDVPRLKLVGPR